MSNTIRTCDTKFKYKDRVIYKASDGVIFHGTIINIIKSFIIAYTVMFDGDKHRYCFPEHVLEREENV